MKLYYDIGPNMFLIFPISSLSWKLLFQSCLTGYMSTDILSLNPSISFQRIKSKDVNKTEFLFIGHLRLTYSVNAVLHLPNNVSFSPNIGFRNLGVISDVNFLLSKISLPFPNHSTSSSPVSDPCYQSDKHVQTNVQLDVNFGKLFRGVFENYSCRCVYSVGFH